MMCPDTEYDCDNPGCRRGGCQGRRPDLPLFRTPATHPQAVMPRFEETMIGRACPPAARGDESTPCDSSRRLPFSRTWS